MAEISKLFSHSSGWVCYGQPEVVKNLMCAGSKWRIKKMGIKIREKLDDTVSHQVRCMIIDHHS